MEKKVHLNPLQQLILLLLAVGSLLVLTTACDNSDEPETAVGYYLTINSTVPIKSAGGLAPPPKNKLIGDITKKMQLAINEVYPVRDQQGDDAAVLTACDNLYRSYCETYRDSTRLSTNSLTGGGFSTKCVVVLYRARMSGYIIRGSSPLKTYRF